MDPRKQRSRDRLYAAALALAAERPISTLTVTQLADAGEAARSTACRQSGSGTAPSKETRSLMTILGTPITR